MNPVQLFLISILLGLAAGGAGAASPDPGFSVDGWSEAVFSVTDPQSWIETLETVGGWEVIHDGATDRAWLEAWQLPARVTATEVLLGNRGATTGFVRLVTFQGAQQQQIRSNGQVWETGGIFDVNVRVLDLDARFHELQARGWQGFADPVELEFGPFRVGEWLGRGPDGIVFALIQRISPPLKDWPNLKRFSRLFNSTQVVTDLDASLAFYVDTLGFEVAMETNGPSDAPGPNVLGLPHNLAATVARRIRIVHPTGGNTGSVELIEFDGVTGRHFGALAAPPNLGITSLRFPVRGIDALAEHLASRQADIVAPISTAPLAPLGQVRVLIVRGPNGERLEFFERVR